MYGKELKEQRLAKELSQEELAKETGIPQRTISYIESDKGIPNVEQCRKLAKFYNISIEELLGFDGLSVKYNNTVKDNHGNITYNQK